MDGTTPQHFGEMNPAKYILLSMRHIPPLVVYLDSPLSYMSEGQANKFYEGEGENTNGKCEDPSVIAYCVIQPLYDIQAQDPSPAPFNINASEVEKDEIYET